MGQTEGRLVPWSLTGFLVMNLVSAFATTSAFHPRLTPTERLENALCSFVCLDLGRLISSELCAARGLRKNDMWIPGQTHTNLQELCGMVAIAAMGLPGDMEWFPGRSSELPLEQWFGSLRSQFASSQMRARDYLHAGAKKMYQTMVKIKDGCAPFRSEIVCPKAVTEEEFVVCARQALQSAVRLMVCSTEFLIPAYPVFLVQILLAMFVFFVFVMTFNIFNAHC